MVKFGTKTRFVWTFCTMVRRSFIHINIPSWIYNCIWRFGHFIVQKLFSTFLIMSVRSFEYFDDSSSYWYSKVSGLSFSYGEVEITNIFNPFCLNNYQKEAVRLVYSQSNCILWRHSCLIRQELFPLDFSTDFRDCLTWFFFIWAKYSPKVQKKKKNCSFLNRTNIR